MGILKRFKDIMDSNINALLDKMENPGKMIDQYIRKAQEDLAEVKKETASVIADELKAKRDLDDCDAEITKMVTYAQKALQAGNDNDARQFLTKKKTLETKRESLSKVYELSHANAEKMRQMHDKLVADIATLDARRDAIKAKMAVAKAQEKVNKLSSSNKSTAASMSAFDRMEAKADKALDSANAMADLNAASTQENIDDLAKKYDNETSDIDDELAAMKAAIGLGTLGTAN